MTRSLWTFSTSRFAVMAALVAGLAAAPASFGDGGLAVIKSNSLAAQEVDAAATPGAEENGEAEEFPTTGEDRIGGTGSVGISSGEQRYADPASVDVVEDAEFRRYAEAAEQNDLEEAAVALSEAADRPITKDYVAEVNSQLGVRTSLTDEQIAEAANDEPLPY